MKAEKSAQLQRHDLSVAQGCRLRNLASEYHERMPSLAIADSRLSIANLRAFVLDALHFDESSTPNSEDVDSSISANLQLAIGNQKCSERRRSCQIDKNSPQID